MTKYVKSLKTSIYLEIGVLALIISMTQQIHQMSDSLNEAKLHSVALAFADINLPLDTFEQKKVASPSGNREVAVDLHINGLAAKEASKAILMIQEYPKISEIALKDTFYSPKYNSVESKSTHPGKVFANPYTMSIASGSTDVFKKFDEKRKDWKKTAELNLKRLADQMDISASDPIDVYSRIQLKIQKGSVTVPVLGFSVSYVAAHFILLLFSIIESWQIAYALTQLSKMSEIEESDEVLFFFEQLSYNSSIPERLILSVMNLHYFLIVGLCLWAPLFITAHLYTSSFITASVELSPANLFVILGFCLLSGCVGTKNQFLLNAKVSEMRTKSKADL